MGYYDWNNSESDSQSDSENEYYSEEEEEEEEEYEFVDVTCPEMEVSENECGNIGMNLKDGEFILDKKCGFYATNKGTFKIQSLDEVFKKEEFKDTVLGGEIDDYNLRRRYIKYDEFVTVEHINSERMSMFPIDKRILAIKSNPGSGKTYQTASWVKKNTQNGENSIAISSRIKFTQNFCDEMKEGFLREGIEDNFTNYLSKDFDVNARHIVCQVESLHKMNNNKRNIVIIDELNTVLECFDSGYHNNNLVMNRDKIRQILRNADRILLLDAYMCPESLDIIHNIINEPIHLIYNHYENKQDYVLYNMNSRENFIEMIKNEYENKKKICIVSNVKSFLDTIKKNKYINIDINRTLTIDSSSEKSVMDNLKEKVCKYDVLFTSPSCGPGVNIDVTHFDVMFVYSKPSIHTCNARYLSQMSHRVRKLNDKKIYYFCEKHNGKNSVDFNTVKTKHENRVNNSLKLIKKYICNRFVKEDAIILNGKFFYQLDVNNPWTKLLIYHKILNNRSLNNYTDEYFYYMAGSGIKILNVDIPIKDKKDENEKVDETPEDKIKNKVIIDVKNSIKESKETIKKEKLESFSKTDVYFDDTILNEINKKIISGEGTKEDYQIYSKSKIFNKFNHEFLMKNENILKISKKEYIQNIINISYEVKSEIFNEISKDYTKIERINEEIENFKSPKLILMRKLCKIVGLKNSYDIESEIDFSKLRNDKKVQDHFHKKFDMYVDIMKCRCKYDGEKFLHINNIVNSCIKSWSGFKFGRGKGKLKQIKKLTCPYGFTTEMIEEMIDNYNITLPEEILKIEKSKNGHVYHDFPKIKIV